MALTKSALGSDERQTINAKRERRTLSFRLEEPAKNGKNISPFMTA